MYTKNLKSITIPAAAIWKLRKVPYKRKKNYGYFSKFLYEEAKARFII